MDGTVLRLRRVTLSLALSGGFLALLIAVTLLAPWIGL